MIKTNRSVSSYEVFASFFSYQEDGTLTGENILSYPCFQAWLATRKKEIKHPRDSFRRTVTAHLRGRDGRRKFPPDVEKSLVQLLHESGEGENGRKLSKPRRNWRQQIWKKCFTPNTVMPATQILGKRERVNANTPCMLNKNDVWLQKPKGTLPREEVYCFPGKGQNGAHNLVSNVRFKTDPYGRIVPTTCPTLLGISAGYSTSTSLSTLPPVVQKHLAEDQSGQSELSRICRTFVEYFPPSTATTLMQRFLLQNQNMWCPSMKFFFDSGSGSLRNDPRLSLSYLKPSPQECVLDPHHESYTIVCTGDDWTMADWSQNLYHFFGKNLLGLPIEEIVESKVQFLMNTSHLFFSLRQGPEAWLRVRMLKRNGKPGSFIFKIEPVGAGDLLCTFQEDSHKFKGLLEKPFFL
eukprot:maker-scaffold_5-snap-gene-9.5-mRNA-1 protein AED:0.00 eAED:0.00 QI:90/1/1/1/1/1/2/490/407